MTIAAADLATLSRLLDTAMDLPVEAREAWLTALPAADQLLVPTLREMLAEHHAPNEHAFMGDGPKLHSDAVDDTVAHADDLIGPYRLIREIGRGGMGTVWLADRADGGLKRQVALKLPRLAWGVGLTERMARERNIGALLAHPNIARLYDAGVDAAGRPYLALEYIDGQPLDAWCEAQALGVPQRLRLFLQVARAVAYAHGRLVVHRDLKPSNVLVTIDGQAHLLDFGIAKLLHEAAPGDAQLTQEQGRILTPHYASPEQIQGDVLSVGSDVYSLGVLLYELLTSRLPHEPDRQSLAALEEAILEGEPPTASSRAKDAARAKALRGELDAILAKALKRYPTQRYATADALADDIERHLAGERVLAQPDSLGYRAAKAWRRQRVGLTAAAAVLLAVLSGAGASLVQAERANEAAARARVVKEFVVDVFKVNERGNPANNELRQLPAELLLERGARLIDTRFPGQPELQAELYGVVGGIFADMGSSKLAIEYATRQVEALTAVHAGDAELARAMLLLADSLSQQDRLSDAALRARQALKLSESDRVLRVRSQVMLVRILVAQARYEEANAVLDQAKSEVAAQPKPLPAELASAEAESLWLRAQLQWFAANPSAAWPLWERAINAALAAEGPNSRLSAAIRIDYAYRLASEKHAAAAKQQLRAALDAMRAVGGPDDIGAALAQSRVFAMLFDYEQVAFDDALAAVTESQQILSSLGSRVPEALRARVDFDLGWIYRRWGDVAKAYALQSAAAVALRKIAESPFALRIIETSVGMDAAEMGRHDEADKLLRHGLELRKVDAAGNPENIAYGYAIVAQNLIYQGKLDEAEEQINAAPLESSFGPIQRALIGLERGDPQAVLKELANFKSSNGRDDDVADLLGTATCRLGQPLEGLSLLDDYIRRRIPLVYEHEAGLARARALAGLCALSVNDRVRAAAYAALARRAFAAQPELSPFYKRPWILLEQRLAAH